MRPYGPDLRERIVNARDEGERPEDIAERFAVSVATVYRYLARRRETGHLEPKPKPGRPRNIPQEANERLRAQVAGAQDATLAQHCEQWVASGGATMHPATMHRAIARLGVTRKKRRSTRASETRQGGHSGGRSYRTSIRTTL